MTNLLDKEVKKGAKAAANKSSSAAAVAKLLSGISFPKNKDEVIEHAEKNMAKVQQPDVIIEPYKR